MKNLAKISVMAMLAMSVVATSCNNDDEGTTPSTPSTGTVAKSGHITANETWTANNIYTLNGKVVVDAGVTLTIEPGTIVKGMTGQGTEASALVVARDAKINAVGDANNPIIFTSALDDITVGQKFGTNLAKEDNQLWGGVVILGNAPISAKNGDDVSNIEGIPADENYGQYGGNNAADNSGSLAYVSIRHGGILIGEDNELNGLTLGGVGTGTSISNIEIYATYDDGVEFFGGTVNVTNLLVFYQGDDGIDIDQNYSGTVSNFAVIHGDGIGTDEGLEIDGPEGTLKDGLFTLSNGICMTEGTEGTPADFKSRAQGYVNNVTFTYPTATPVKIHTAFDGSCNHEEDAYSHLAIVSPASLVFADSKIESVIVEDDNETTCDLSNAQSTAENLVVMNGAGASIVPGSVFSWSCAGLRNQL